MNPLIKRERRNRRHRRIRVKIAGMIQRPRLCVFRSKKHIYAQLIDDEKGKTLASARDLEIKPKAQAKNKKNEEDKKALAGKLAIAFEVGQLIAEKAKKLKIERAVFDRGGYKYHGRVRALEQGARKRGLKF